MEDYTYILLRDVAWEIVSGRIDPLLNGQNTHQSKPNGHSRLDRIFHEMLLKLPTIITTPEAANKMCFHFEPLALRFQYLCLPSEPTSHRRNLNHIFMDWPEVCHANQSKIFFVLEPCRVTSSFPRKRFV